MEAVTIIGVDLAKNVFQLHGAAEDGSVVFRRKLSRLQFGKFMASHPPCVVAMEACGSSHYWARQMARLGHEPRLIAPSYVKPFIKRQKNDAADAEAIVEATQRPTMRFVEPKTEGLSSSCSDPSMVRTPKAIAAVASTVSAWLRTLLRVNSQLPVRCPGVHHAS